MNFPLLQSAEDIAALVNEIGFLPFFRNRIPGFSIEEHTPPERWFSDALDGPWEWKGPVLRLSGGAYGKFFQNKAGFISRAWFPDFANYRRDGYDFDARYDDGLAGHRDLMLISALEKTGPTLSMTLKREAGYGGKDGLKGFDTVITRLQMQTYVITSDFAYRTDRFGKPYGWGVCRYATPEQVYGEGFGDLAYSRQPEESYEKILSHLRALLPHADEAALKYLIG